VQRKRKKLWKERKKDLTEPVLLEMDVDAVTGKVDYLSYFTSGVRQVHRIPFEIDFLRRIE
jgi:hypothetical protein